MKLYNPKDYRTNRKTVLDVREKVRKEMKTAEEIEFYGIPLKDLKRWANEEKIRSIVWKGKRYYHLEQAKELFLKVNLLPGMQTTIF